MRAGAPQVREHWHLVLGAPDAQPWPAGSEAGGEPLRAPLMRGCAVLQSAAAACIEALAAADMCEAVGQLCTACREVEEGCDPSVLDSFLYAPPALSASPTSPTSPPSPTPEPSAGPTEVQKDRPIPSICWRRPLTLGDACQVHMSDHVDPGVLTLTRASDAPGLEIWDTVASAWVCLSTASPLHLPCISPASPVSPRGRSMWSVARRPTR